jgi:hypothetical protein
VKIPQQTVNLKLKKEMSKLRISGPFYTPPFQNFVCSPLGLVPKKEHGQFRLNHDLSFPKGNSVNSCIPSEFTTVNYQNIETVVELVQFYGPKWQNVTFRIAFLLLPMHKDDHHLLGFHWQGQFDIFVFYPWVLLLLVKCSNHFLH